MSKCVDCSKTASFGLPGGKKQYCKTHKKNGMDNVTNNIKCLDCNKYASFGFPEGKKKYCIKHKKEGMVNLRKTIIALCLDDDNSIMAICLNTEEEYSNNDDLNCDRIL